MTSALLDQRETDAVKGEDDLRLFLQDIRRFPLLSAEEERQLAKRCAEGDEAAVRQMVNSNLRLVVSMARDYAGRGVDLLDLIQEGSIGLLVAARKFDYTRDNRFSTYATKWIYQGITRCLMNQGAAIRVPQHTAERMKKVQLAKAALLQQTGEEPTLFQIAQRAGLPESKVEEYLRLMPEVCSLDAPTGEGEDGTLAWLIEDAQAPQPQEELVRRELEHTIGGLLELLTQRQQRLLRLRFGMEDGNRYSLEAIGEKLGVSKERARQLERQAIDKLQKLSAGLGLEDFLNE